MDIFENERLEISVIGFEDLAIGDVIIVSMPSGKKYYHIIIKKYGATLKIKKLNFFERLKFRIKWVCKHIADFLNSYYCKLKRSIKKWQKK